MQGVTQTPSMQAYGFAMSWQSRAERQGWRHSILGHDREMKRRVKLIVFVSYFSSIPNTFHSSMLPFLPSYQCRGLSFTLMSSFSPCFQPLSIRRLVLMYLVTSSHFLPTTALFYSLCSPLHISFFLSPSVLYLSFFSSLSFIFFPLALSRLPDSSSFCINP